MMVTEAYYHACIMISPYLCKSYTRDVVISEDPLELIGRSAESLFDARASVLMIRQIPEWLYRRHKKLNIRGYLNFLDRDLVRRPGPLDK